MFVIHFIQFGYYRFVFTSLVLHSFKNIFEKCCKSITISGSSNKSQDFREDRWVVNISWNINVEMWHTNDRKRECFSLIAEVKISLLSV